MIFEHSGTRVMATRNRNRNMVLAMLQRVPPAHDPVWADGLARFGVLSLIGVGDRIKLFCDDFPYEWWPSEAKNDNISGAV